MYGREFPSLNIQARRGSGENFFRDGEPIVSKQWKALIVSIALFQVMLAAAIWFEHARGDYWSGTELMVVGGFVAAVCVNVLVAWLFRI